MTSAFPSVAFPAVAIAALAFASVLAAAAPAWSETLRGSVGPKAAAAPPSSAKPAASAKDRSSAFGELGSNRQPIKIDADRLDVFDKEGRAVFTGNIVAVQGDSTMRCTLLTVFYEGGRAAAIAGGGGGTPAPQGSGGTANPLGSDGAIRKINCRGPVTITSKTQVATGDNAEFDRRANKVVLTGNAALSDGPNVTRGERVNYDITSGIASIEGGRVRALIVPGSGDKGGSPRPR